MTGILRCTTVVVSTAFVLAWGTAWAQEPAEAREPAEPAQSDEPQDLEAPPPPPSTEVELVPDPELESAAAQHVDRQAAEPSPSFQDALREEDRDAALQAVPLGRTPALACLEAMLLELRAREVYMPPLETDSLTLRVVEVQSAVLVETTQPLRFAYARCLATIHLAPAFDNQAPDLRERARSLEQVHALVAAGPSAAHPAMLGWIEALPVLSWDALRELYVASHGAVRDDPNEERLEGWQNAAVVTSGVLFGGSLLALLLGVRIDAVDTGRYLLSALGTMIGTFPGLMLARTWTNPESEWTPHRLMSGALITLGAIGGGIALFRADVKRRHQLLGATMAASAVGNLVWLVGGLGVYRRQRRGLRGGPTIEIAHRSGSVGWTGSF